MGGAFEVLLDCNSPADLEPEHRIVKTKTYDNYKESFGYIENRHRGTSLPTITCSPRQPNGNVAVLLHDHGKAAFFEVDGMPKPEILSLLSSGVTVILPDLFLQGDFNRDVHAPLFTRKVPNPRDFAGFTFGYNDTLFAQRVSDILTIVTYSHDLDPKTQAVHVIGLHGTGPHVAAARAIAGGAIETAAIDTAGFRFADIASWRDPNFLPGAVKYGDLPALLALGAPNPIWLAGEGGTIPEIMQHAYRTTGHEPAVVVSGAAPASTASAAIDWLLVRIQHDQPSKSNE